MCRPNVRSIIYSQILTSKIEMVSYFDKLARSRAFATKYQKTEHFSSNLSFWVCNFAVQTISLLHSNWEWLCSDFVKLNVWFSNQFGNCWSPDADQVVTLAEPGLTQLPSCRFIQIRTQWSPGWAFGRRHFRALSTSDAWCGWAASTWRQG